MKKLAIILVLALIGCSGRPLPTYDQLKSYPLDCKHQQAQLSELKEIMRLKYFDPNPDNLNESDRAYRALLKEHIWWFAYNCEQ